MPEDPTKVNAEGIPPVGRPPDSPSKVVEPGPVTLSYASPGSRRGWWQRRMARIGGRRRRKTRRAVRDLLCWFLPLHALVSALLVDCVGDCLGYPRREGRPFSLTYEVSRYIPLHRFEVYRFPSDRRVTDRFRNRRGIESHFYGWGTYSYNCVFVEYYPDGGSKWGTYHR